MKKIFNKRAALFAGGALSFAACILALPYAPNFAIIFFGGLSTFLIAEGLAGRNAPSNEKPIPAKI